MLFYPLVLSVISVVNTLSQRIRTNVTGAMVKKVVIADVSSKMQAVYAMLSFKNIFMDQNGHEQAKNILKLIQRIPIQ